MPQARPGGGCSCGMTARDVEATRLCRVPGCPFPQLVEGRLPRSRESDLRHGSNPVRFGYAMLRCEGYAPACSDAGRCSNGGRCFGSRPNLVAARMVEAMIPADGHAVGVHYAYLRRVAELLREEAIGI